MIAQRAPPPKALGGFGWIMEPGMMPCRLARLSSNAAPTTAHSHSPMENTDRRRMSNDWDGPIAEPTVIDFELELYHSNFGKLLAATRNLV